MKRSGLFAIGIAALLSGCVVYDPAAVPGALIEPPSEAVAPAYPYYPPPYYAPAPVYPYSYYPSYRPYWYGPAIGLNFGFRFDGRRRR